MPEVTNTSTKAHPGSSSADSDTLSVLIKQYALDLRRNASGGDDYPWEFAKGVSDYLGELIKRAKGNCACAQAGFPDSCDNCDGPTDTDCAELVRELRLIANAGDVPPKGHPSLAHRAADALERLMVQPSSAANDEAARALSRNAMAETIHNARWPAERQMAITPFADEDRNGREYCFRIADAVLASIGVAQPPANPWRDDFENAPTEMHEYFLVRPKGIHPGRGGLFLPTIVQRIDGEFYATDNEIDPIYFGQNEADDHPLKTTLEWQPLPSNWTCSISSTERGGA